MNPLKLPFSLFPLPKRRPGQAVAAIVGSAVSLASFPVGIPAVALPPPEDIPEEVLRTQIILEGRSPQSGELLSAEAYAEQDAATAAALDAPGTLPAQIQQIVMILRIRKVLRTVIPIIP
jgi:hypothetical protein